MEREDFDFKDICIEMSEGCFACFQNNDYLKKHKHGIILAHAKYVLENIIFLPDNSVDVNNITLSQEVNSIEENKIIRIVSMYFLIKDFKKISILDWKFFNQFFEKVNWIYLKNQYPEDFDEMYKMALFVEENISSVNKIH